MIGTNKVELLINDICDEVLGQNIEGIARVPELLPVSIETLENLPKTYRIFISYLFQIKTIFELTEKDKEIIENAYKLLNERRSEKMPSASKYTILQFLEEIEPIKDDVLKDLSIKNAFCIENIDFKNALEKLSEMMEGGHEMSIEGLSPKDGDPRSDGVIYGHTQIKNPWTLVHFTICHFTERYMSIIFQKYGLEASYHKDWFLNLLTDSITLQLAKGKVPALNIAYEWIHPRNEDGLGWIKNDRLEAFSDAYRISEIEG